MSAETMVVASFLPQDRRLALADGRTLPDRTDGAALFADISGFTRLTESLARSLGARRGAEVLTQALGEVFTALIAEVDRHRGSVIGFSGDAITCWFDEDDGSRATAAALAMQEAMRPFAALRLPGGHVGGLSVKIAVAHGPVRRFVVGEPSLQRFDVLAGRTLDLLASVERLSRPGEVLVAAGDDLAAGLVVESWRADEASGRRVAVVVGLERDVALRPWPVPDGDALRDERLSSWLPQAVYDRLRQGGGRFLADFRPAAALFLSFEGIDYDGEPLAGERLDAVIRWVQATIHRLEGTIVQLTIGDKGSYLYAAFGAPLAHRDDAARAVEAALALQRPPASLAFVRAVRIGLSYGPMYAGAYGSADRRTYGVLSSKTNLAARLMGSAEPGGILCDAEVERRARHRWAFDALPPLTVKGRDDAIAVFAPTRGAATRGTDETPLAGRAAETERLRALLAGLRAGRGHVLSVRAEAGMGKTRLVAALRAEAEHAGVRVLAGAGQSVEQGKPYLAWRDVFDAYFDIGGLADPAEQLARVTDAFETHLPERLPMLPLLEDVLDLGLVDPPSIAVLDANARRDRLFDLLVDLLRRRLREGPLLLILEDAHWLDSLSWRFAEHVGRVVAAEAPLLLVVVGRARPTGDEGEASDVLAALPGGERLDLEPLPPEAVDALVARQLDVPAGVLPTDVAALVRERSGGNPFVAEELVRALLDRDLLRVEEAGGRRRVVGRAAAAADLLPDTVQGLILSRLDRLPVEQQILLRVAAVIGRVFALRALRDTVTRLELVRDFRRRSVRALAEQDFIEADAQAKESTYLFRHLITYEAVYEALLFSQRRFIHRAVAEWFESTYADRLQDVTNVLGHHYAHAAHGADDDALLGKAVHYLEVALEQQSMLGAFREALTAARRMLEILPVTERWAWKRAEAMVGAGSQLEKTSAYAEASEYFRDGLEIAREHGHKASEVKAHTGLCLVAMRQGRYPEAREAGELALELALRYGDDQGAAQARSSLGIVAAFQGELAVAREHFASGVEVYRKLGDLGLMAPLLNNLGMVAIYEEDYEVALERLSEALGIVRTLGHRDLMAKVIANLGLVAEKREDYALAERQYLQSLAIFREIGARQDAAINVLSLGDVEAAQGKEGAAWDFYREAFAEAAALNALPTALLALRGLAGLLADGEEAWVAAQLLGFALGHSASNNEVEQHAEPVLAVLRRRLGEASLEAALGRGRALDLERVAELVARCERSL